VDGIALWAEGKDDQEVAAKLTKTAETACEWAGKSGVAFNHGKSEAIFFSRRGTLRRQNGQRNSRNWPIRKQVQARTAYGPTWGRWEWRQAYDRQLPSWIHT